MQQVDLLPQAGGYAASEASVCVYMCVGGRGWVGGWVGVAAPVAADPVACAGARKYAASGASAAARAAAYLAPVKSAEMRTSKKKSAPEIEI